MGHPSCSDCRKNVKKEIITVADIVPLFQKYNVKKDFDLLSIDLDWNDYWVLEAILKEYKPLMIVAEVNRNCFVTDLRKNDCFEPRTIPDQPISTKPNITTYFGMNVPALEFLGKKYGYSMVYCEKHTINCFLIYNYTHRYHYLSFTPNICSNYSTWVPEYNQSLFNLRTN